MGLATRVRSCSMAPFTNNLKSSAVHCPAAKCRPDAGNTPQEVAQAGLRGSSRKGRSQRAASMSTERFVSQRWLVEQLIAPVGWLQPVQADELQYVQRELLAVRECLKPLRRRRQEELMKDEVDEAELDQVKRFIAHSSAQELRLLRDLERLETRPAGLETGKYVMEFAAAIPDFPEQPDEDGFLHFPVPVPFLEGSTVMLVREVYKDLWEHVANSSLKGFVVSGNEDTGKSWWLVWVLIQLLKAGEEVLWHDECEGAAEYTLFDGKGGVKKVNFGQASKLLEEGDSRLCYLVDGAVPHANKRYNFKLSLVAHSYKPDRFRNYMQHMHSTFSSPLIMATWGWTDILKVKERLTVLGNFPRHVFADSSDEQPLAEVERAVADLTVNNLALGFDRHAVGCRDSATSRLTMIAPLKRRDEGDFTSWEVVFRSFDITGRVADKIGPRAIGLLINGC